MSKSELKSDWNESSLTEFNDENISQNLKIESNMALPELINEKNKF